jgi:hypothetical protein
MAGGLFGEPEGKAGGGPIRLFFTADKELGKEELIFGRTGIKSRDRM